MYQKSFTLCGDIIKETYNSKLIKYFSIKGRIIHQVSPDTKNIGYQVWIFSPDTKNIGCQVSQLIIIKSFTPVTKNIGYQVCLFSPDTKIIGFQVSQ